MGRKTSKRRKYGNPNLTRSKEQIVNTRIIEIKKSLKSRAIASWQREDFEKEIIRLEVKLGSLDKEKELMKKIMNKKEKNVQIEAMHKISKFKSSASNRPVSGGLPSLGKSRKT